LHPCSGIQIKSVQREVREGFTSLPKAFARICAIDSRRWIQFLLNVLPKIEEYQEGDFSALEKRMLQMFHFTKIIRSTTGCSTGRARVQPQKIP
jgi:hypothetical protein